MHADAVQTMITMLRVFPVDRSDLLVLYYLINQGLPFGKVTTLANKLRLQRGNRADFFCFGDPKDVLSHRKQRSARLGKARLVWWRL